jgi:hypothetical protein
MFLRSIARVCSKSGKYVKFEKKNHPHVLAWAHALYCGEYMRSTLWSTERPWERDYITASHIPHEMVKPPMDVTVQCQARSLHTPLRYYIILCLKPFHFNLYDLAISLAKWLKLVGGIQAVTGVCANFLPTVISYIVRVQCVLRVMITCGYTCPMKSFQHYVHSCLLRNYIVHPLSSSFTHDKRSDRCD